MRPTLYAHRGAPLEAPENTIASFRLGLDLGADALETDCHMTRDGYLVVSHDPHGARTAHVAREIRASAFADVREWDVGEGFLDREGKRPFAGKRHRMPLLEEVISEFSGVRINVDAKQTRPDIVPALVRLVRRMRALEHVRIASFSSSILRRVRELGYEGETGLSQREVANVVLLPRALLARPKGNAIQIPTRAAGIDLTSRAFVDKCHALGLRVDYWTIDDPSLAEKLLDAGADGVMTDDPRAIAPVFRTREK